MLPLVISTSFGDGDVDVITTVLCDKMNYTTWCHGGLPLLFETACADGKGIITQMKGQPIRAYQ